jgi:hypothetical protein
MFDCVYWTSLDELEHAKFVRDSKGHRVVRGELAACIGA